MMIRDKQNLVNIVAVLLLATTGCASFHGNQLPKVASLPVLSENTHKPSISYSFSSGSMITRQEYLEEDRKKFEDEFVCVLRESGYFTSLDSESRGEISIKARLVNSVNPLAMIPAFISGLSLGIIPSWAADKYTVTAEVRAIDGITHTYKLEDSATTVIWLPLIVAVPSKSYISVPKEVRRNIYMNLVLRMQQDGILYKQKITDGN